MEGSARTMEKLTIVTILFGLICMAYSHPTKADQFKDAYDEMNEIEGMLSDMTEDDYMMDDMFDDEDNTMNDPQTDYTTAKFKEGEHKTNYGSWLESYEWSGK